MNQVNYRSDIDGLRAYAVISVILFHLGWFPNGYLGVDIFFVISGYLITKIVYSETEKNKFSILKFYERRIRRIIPLLLFTSFVALILGVLLMLPDDLENLAQSVIASNFSLNNILMYITSADYWAVANDYKPLMHTWSLGIEEQFYLLYPFLFFFLKGKRIRFILYVLIGLAIASLFLFFIQDNAASKFFFIQYRFFELATGGLCAIIFKNEKLDGSGKGKILDKLYNSNFLLILILFLIFILISGNVFSNEMKVVAVTVITSLVLVLGEKGTKNSRIYHFIAASNPVVFVGKISFSLYMWHQILLAFGRYTLIEKYELINAIIVLIITFILSYLTWRWIENPFRDKTKMKTKNVLLTVLFTFILLTTVASYLFITGGIIRDVPELNIVAEKKINFSNALNKDNIHIRYNEKIRQFDVDFSNNENKNILVIGSSFGRDFTNILFESGLLKDADVSYFDEERILKDKNVINRVNQADIVFFASRDLIDNNYLRNLEKIHQAKIDLEKFFFVGTKDFGYTNGIIYNRLRVNPEISYDELTVAPKDGVLETHKKMKILWKNRYIDLLQYVITVDNRIKVFTPEKKFISHDTIHLTREGAEFFGNKLHDNLKDILSGF
jgi:peptidoglycan/LPS O-acetylase OafA/YrhL